MSDTVALATDIIGKFFTLGGILQREGNRLLAPFGVNQQQFSLLFEIGKAKRVRQKDVKNRLMLEKAHVSKAVKKLQAMALITIEHCTEDRRVTWLSVTETGMALLANAQKEFAQWNEEWFATIDNETLRALQAHLMTVEEAFVQRLTEE